MRRAVVIIGCSYGDEGKGLAASLTAKRMDGPCLNVLINGGAQRGHTVDLPDGRRHVFHHFGSAAFSGAVSCADEDFIVNPLLYVQEKEELETGFRLSPRLMIHRNCRVTTPWDMMLGQIIEESRGKGRHGSCGCGIYETILRSRQSPWALRWGGLSELKEPDFFAYSRRILREYLPQRLAGLGINASPEWRRVLEDEGIVRHAWEDIQAMKAQTETYSDWASEASSWPNLLFEAGQGLALDAENTKDFPHLTPSRTTSLVSARRISELEGETETMVLYVTRSYLTRHGAGPFPTECPKETINREMTDLTNLPNPHQQSLRYGRFDGRAVLERIRTDLEASRNILSGISAGILVTHLNETGGCLAGDMDLKTLISHFDLALLSDCPWSAYHYS